MRYLSAGLTLALNVYLLGYWTADLVREFSWLSFVGNAAAIVGCVISLWALVMNYRTAQIRREIARLQEEMEREANLHRTRWMQEYMERTGRNGDEWSDRP